MLIKVSDMMSVMDTGIQDSILSGRRRLLAHEGRKLLGFRTSGGGGAKGIFSKMMHVMTGMFVMILWP